jgi:hypothetical protein
MQACEELSDNVFFQIFSKGINLRAQGSVIILAPFLSVIESEGLSYAPAWSLLKSSSGWKNPSTSIQMPFIGIRRSTRLML